MTQDEVYPKLTGVFQDVFDDDDLRLTRDTTAASVPGWDSLGHIRLMLAVEKKFKVKFKGSEISSLKNVGELADLVAKKSG